MANATKRCRVCGERKPLKRFSIDRSRKDGHCNRCKACDSGHDSSEPQTCQRCGAIFYGRKRKYCRANCGRNPRGRSEIIPCEICGEPFKRLAEPKRDGYQQRTCSQACGVEYRRREHGTAGGYRLEGQASLVIWASCAVCHTTYIVRSTVRRCGCNRNGREYRPHDAACRECGAVFTAKSIGGRPRTTFCSAACCERASRRTDKHRRRAAKKAGERFTLYEIAERDGWRCHLCGRKVKRGAASLDHLIPISAGGEHVRSNVALAHHRCNSLRSDRGAAQLLLIG